MQKAIGAYNTDLFIDPISVELFGGSWHSTNSRSSQHFSDRLRYMLDQGWNQVIIWVDTLKWPMSEVVADYVVAFLEQSRSDPTFRRQYRVIFGDGKVVPVAELDINNLTSIPSRAGCEDFRP